MKNAEDWFEVVVSVLLVVVVVVVICYIRDVSQTNQRRKEISDRLASCCK